MSKTSIITAAKNEVIPVPFSTKNGSGGDADRTAAGTLHVVRQDLESGTITGITAANPAVVTSASHGLSNGDQVIIFGVAGMVEINGIIATVANQTTNTFECSGLNSSGFTAYTSGGTWRKVEVITAGLSDVISTAAGVDVDGNGTRDSGLSLVYVNTGADAEYIHNRTYMLALLDATLDSQTVSDWLAVFKIGGAVIGTIDNTSVTADASRFECDDITDAQTGRYKYFRVEVIQDGAGSAAGMVAFVNHYEKNGSNGQFRLTGLGAAPGDNAKVLISPP